MSFHHFRVCIFSRKIGIFLLIKYVFDKIIISIGLARTRTSPLKNVHILVKSEYLVLLSDHNFKYILTTDQSKCSFPLNHGWTTYQPSGGKIRNIVVEISKFYCQLPEKIFREINLCIHNVLHSAAGHLLVHVVLVFAASTEICPSKWRKLLQIYGHLDL